MSVYEDDRSRSTCPFLGTRDDEGKPAPCVDYPSFENMCFVGAQSSAIMLTDQATFCLSTGHRHCPRLASEIDTTSRGSARSSRTEPAGAFASADSSDPLLHAIADMEQALEARRRARAKRKRRWGWTAAIAVFLSSILCGGIFAAYAGWQFVSRESAASTAGTVTTLAEAATQAPQPLFLIVTATSDASGAPPPVSTPKPDQSLNLPAAVTATPSTGITGQALATFGPPSAGQAAAQGAGAAPSINMLVQIPTRRPTPILDLAIVVPTLPNDAAAPTLSPTPPLGTPVVVFAADDEELESGKCTRVSWHVENVSAVYYENIGVDGHGEAEECVRDKPGDYMLTVVLPNGSTQYYTLTVGLVLPTETPTPTATRPPYVEPTPSWTPVIPTETPTPNMQYGVLLTVEDGSAHSCTPGETCDIELRMTNTSLGIDDISVQFLQSGRWAARLCRLDGVCSDSKLTLASVGPGNTALVALRVDVPARAAGNSESYVLRAVSERSGGSAGSDAVTVDVTAE